MMPRALSNASLIFENPPIAVLPPPVGKHELPCPLRRDLQCLFGKRPDEILFLLYHSAYKPVQERIRNYFQKYLPTIQEFPLEEWAAAESKAGPRRNAEKVREEVITNLLDRRPRPPSTPSSPMSPPPPVIEAAGIRRVR